MFRTFAVAPQYSKNSNRKISLGHKHDYGSLQTPGNNIREASRNWLSSINSGKAMENLRKLWAMQRVQLLLYAKSSKNQELSKNKAPRQERFLLRALQCNRFEPLQNVVLAFVRMCIDILVLMIKPLLRISH